MPITGLPLDTLTYSPVQPLTPLLQPSAPIPSKRVLKKIRLPMFWSDTAGVVVLAEVENVTPSNASVPGNGVALL